MRTTNAVWALDLPHLLLPIAVGRAASLKRLNPEMTAALFLQAFAASLVSAAVRLLPLGQTEGQRVLASLASLCQGIAQDTATDALTDIYSNAFLSDVASLAHDTLEPRIFQS